MRTFNIEGAQQTTVPTTARVWRMAIFGSELDFDVHTKILNEIRSHAGEIAFGASEILIAAMLSAKACPHENVVEYEADKAQTLLGSTGISAFRRLIQLGLIDPVHESPTSTTVRLVLPISIVTFIVNWHAPGSRCSTSWNAPSPPSG